MSKKLPFRVRKGALIPANSFAETAMREMKLSLGDIVFCEITKPRNPRFNNLVHRFGELIANNIESFSGMDPHLVLKRLQVEGDIACTHIWINIPQFGMVEQRLPESLSFASMDETRFSEVFKQFCRFVADKYWPTLSDEQIAQMAEVMADE